MAKCPPMPTGASCGLPNRHPKITIKNRSVYRNGKYFAFILAHNEKEKKLIIRIRNKPSLCELMQGDDYTITTMYYT